MRFRLVFVSAAGLMAASRVIFGPSLTPLTRTTGRMCRHGKTLGVRGNLIAERRAKELWHGSTGAVQMFASVSEGFLHRNRVLSVPSKPPLSVVLSKPGMQKMNWSMCWMCEIWTLDFIGCILRFARFLGRISTCYRVANWLDRAHFLSWTSSFELTSWLMKKNGFHFCFEAPFVWTHEEDFLFFWQMILAYPCHSVSWLAPPAP